MHEFSSNVNKVNKAVAKVTTIGDRLLLKNLDCRERFGKVSFRWPKTLSCGDVNTKWTKRIC